MSKRSDKIKVELTERQLEQVILASAPFKDAVTRRAYSVLKAALDKHNQAQVSPTP